MLNPINTFNSSLTHSTGPKPSQLVPKVLRSAFYSQNHLKEQNKHKLIFIAASIHCPVNNPLQHWWNQCQSISQWETPPWESCSKLPLQSFVSPPPKSFYRSSSKECDTSVSLIIVSLDHAGRAGFSWCAHGKGGHEWGHLWQYCMWGCLILFCLSSTDIVTLLPPKWPDFQMLHLIPNYAEQTSSLCFDSGGGECGTEAAPGRRRRHRAAGRHHITTESATSKLENNNFVLLKKNNITVVNPLLFSPL